MNLLELQVLVVVSRISERGAGPSLLDWPAASASRSMDASLALGSAVPRAGNALLPLGPAAAGSLAVSVTGRGARRRGPDASSPSRSQ